MDSTEGFRKAMVDEINSNPGDRAALEAIYGQVWNEKELREDFEVLGSLAPFVSVVRRSDGAEGSVLFQDCPRFYYSFQEDAE